ncbi:MAG: hypothetical protein P8O20_04960, partial [Bacteroidia bacterium]|nr:hypothetical protein [Bacteroidia bacterium]
MLAWIILLPLIGFAFSILFGKKLPKPLVGFIASVVVLGSFLFSIDVFNTVSADPNGISERL